jgi:hypothetical protein
LPVKLGSSTQTSLNPAPFGAGLFWRKFMKPLFTIHIGEYLLGEKFQTEFKDSELWIPTKDTGIDFLMSKKNNTKKNISIQVKYSKDFLLEHSSECQKICSAYGWWTLNTKKIIESTADIWALVLYCFEKKKIYIMMIEPKKLLMHLEKLNGKIQKHQLYLTVLKDGKKCFSNPLKKEEIESIVQKDYSVFSKERNFSDYLEYKNIITKLLK